MISTRKKNPNWAMLTKYNWLQLNCTHFTFDSPIKKVKAVFTSICNEMKRIQKRIYIVFLKKNLKSKKHFCPGVKYGKVFFSHMNANRWLMSCSCHLDKASNVEIGVECQIFVIVIFYKCGQVLQFGAHSRYYKGALTQKRSFLVLCTTFRSDFHFGWKKKNIQH